MTGARQAVSRKVRRGATLTSPRTTANYLMARLAQHPYEVFTLIYLDNRHRLTACQDLFRGTIDGASLHPSGVAEPSQADEIITRRVKDALALVDIRVLDHVFVAERGLL